MSAAGPALQAAAMEKVAGAEGAGGVYPGPPLQAALPYAVVETGPETDWSHKSGAGREVRLAVVVRAGGERPDRAQALAAAAEAAVGGGLEPDGWRVVTLAFLRSRCVRDGRGDAAAWAVTIEYRARMLAAG
jgi:hypothetical protein